MEDLQNHAVIGAAMAVHRELGEGFLEQTYQHALAIEFTARAIPFEREVAMPIHYRGIQLGGRFRADFVCFGALIIETKAMPNIHERHVSQLAHYLSATRRDLGLLLNFGAPSLQVRRIKPRRGAAKGPSESAESRGESA